MADSVHGISVNTAAEWVFLTRGTPGLIDYLDKILKAAGLVTEVSVSTDTTSILVGTQWEIAIVNTPITPLLEGTSRSPSYTLWYHIRQRAAVHIGTVDNITLVVAVVTSTTTFN